MGFSGGLSWRTPGLCGGGFDDQLHSHSWVLALFHFCVVGQCIFRELCGNGCWLTTICEVFRKQVDSRKYVKGLIVRCTEFFDYFSLMAVSILVWFLTG